MQTQGAREKKITSTQSCAIAHLDAVVERDLAVRVRPVLHEQALGPARVVGDLGGLGAHETDEARRVHVLAVMLGRQVLVRVDAVGPAGRQRRRPALRLKHLLRLVQDDADPVAGHSAHLDYPLLRWVVDKNL